MSEARFTAHLTHYPGDDAPTLNLLTCGRIGILCSYALVGFVPAFVATPTTVTISQLHALPHRSGQVYLVESLDASPVQQNTIGALATLPWCFKTVSGILTDLCQLEKSRRRSYILAGHATSALLLVLVGVLVGSGDMNVKLFSLFTFLITMAQITADTAAVSSMPLLCSADAAAAAGCSVCRAQLESPIHPGQGASMGLLSPVRRRLCRSGLLLASHL